MEFGDRLKRLRSVQGLSVRELARRVGVSGSYISQLESSECHPSFSVFRKIAQVLDAPTSVLTGDALPEEWVIVRKNERRHVASDDPLHEVDLVAFMGSRDRRMQPCFVRLKPGADGPSEVFTHDRDDVIYVVEGNLEVRSNGTEYVLSAGDVAYFGMNRPESFRNPGPADTTFFWVVSPSR